MKIKSFFLLFNLFVHMCLISFLGTSGCPWPAWLSSCSCGISSMRFSAGSADTRTTSASSTTWRPGENYISIEFFPPFFCLMFLWFFVCSLLVSSLFKIHSELLRFADLPLLLRRSWQPTTTTAPSAGTPCWRRANYPVVISSTSKVFDFIIMFKKSYFTGTTDPWLST